MRRRLLPFVLGLVAVHIAAIAVLRGGGRMFVSNICVTLASLVPAAACYWRSRLCGPTTRSKWNFAAIAFALWSVGQALYTWYENVLKLQSTSALSSDFYFFLYGVPLLLAISSSNEEHGSPVFLIIDSFQAIFAVCVAYVQLFSVLPAFDHAAPISAFHLLQVYAAENFALAVVCSLRLLPRSEGEERVFFRLICTYLWFYAVLATVLNYNSVIHEIPTGTWLDALWDLPFLGLAVAIVRIPVGKEPEEDPSRRSNIALIMNNASPIFFTLAVLAMGASVARRHLGLGILVIAIAVVIYCVRSAILQSAYLRTQSAFTRSQQALREANDRLQRLSYLDPLTAIANRRQFDRTLEVEWNRAIRARQPLSLAMIDIDCFKTLNDRYGHPHGDACLTRVAATLRDTLRRSGDLLARYGGEEFAAILPGVSLENAVQLAETMRHAVMDLGMENLGSTAHGVVTVSIGIAAQTPGGNAQAYELLAAADAALYRAKCNGRNCVEIALPVEENVLLGSDAAHREA